jgi:hypothetical protein
VTRKEGRLAMCEEGRHVRKGAWDTYVSRASGAFFCTSFFYANKLKNIGYLHVPTTTRQQWPTLATKASWWAVLNSLTHPRTPSSLQSRAGGVLFYTTTHPQAGFKRELVGHFYTSSYYLAHSNCRYCLQVRSSGLHMDWKLDGTGPEWTGLSVLVLNFWKWRTNQIPVPINRSKCVKIVSCSPEIGL